MKSGFGLQFRAQCLLLTGAMFVGVTSMADAADYWQVQSGNVTVVAVGRKPAAAETATMVVRLQHAARWMAGWPADFQPPAVLALAPSDEVIERYFGRRPTSEDDTLGPRADQGLVFSVPQTSVLVFSVSRKRGREFEQLQLLYGRELLDSGPSSQWPDCVRLGMGIILASGDLRKEHHLYVPVGRVAFPLWWDTYPFAPRDFIDPAATTDATEFTRDRRAYSCYMLALMAVRGEPVPRAQFAEYFRLIGAGTDFDQAAQSAFGLSDAEFTEKLREFARRLRLKTRPYDMDVELVGEVPAWPEPEPVSAERMHNILTSLASRLTGSPAP